MHDYNNVSENSGGTFRVADDLFNGVDENS